MIDLVLITGTLGAIIIVSAFVMNQFKYINRDSFSYDFWNFIGAVLLVIYAWALHSYPFMVINIVWSLVSLRDLFKKRQH